MHCVRFPGDENEEAKAVAWKIRSVEKKRRKAERKQGRYDMEIIKFFQAFSYYIRSI